MSSLLIFNDIKQNLHLILKYKDPVASVAVYLASKEHKASEGTVAKGEIQAIRWEPRLGLNCAYK